MLHACLPYCDGLMFLMLLATGQATLLCSCRAGADDPCAETQEIEHRY